MEAERIQPTRPGWWWRQGNHGPYIEQVDGDQNHALFVSLSGTDVTDDGTWLAEVPTPAVCRAVARRIAAEFALEQADVLDSRLEWIEYQESKDDLDAAIEAVNDATRKGQEVAP